MSAGRWRCPTGGRAAGAVERPRDRPGVAGQETARSYLMLRAASRYGGTNEIMKNIVSKADLGTENFTKPSSLAGLDPAIHESTESKPWG